MPRPIPVEQALVAYLGPKVTPATVATKVPQTRPAAFVKVTRAGGDVLSIGQSRVRVLFECWASTDSAAWTLAGTTWGAVWDADDPDEIHPGVEVMEVELSEPVNYPDLASGSPRYQFLASLTVNLKE